MLVQVGLDGTPHELKQITQVGLDGTVRALRQLWQNDASGTPRLIFSALSVAITPPYLSGSTNRKASGTINLGYATANITGGVSPFSYVWTATDGFSSAPANSPTVSVISPTLTNGDTLTGTITVTVTDATGAAETSGPIDLSASNYGFPA